MARALNIASAIRSRSGSSVDRSTRLPHLERLRDASGLGDLEPKRRSIPVNETVSDPIHEGSHRFRNLVEHVPLLVTLTLCRLLPEEKDSFRIAVINQGSAQGDCI